MNTDTFGTLPGGCSRSMWGALPMIHVSVGEHALDLSLFGGQLLGWKFRGRDILFLNREHSLVDGKTPYRGGVPICFPHFNRGALFFDGKLREPSHGPVRTQLWDLVDLQTSGQAASIKLCATTKSTDTTPPTPLEISVTYRIAGPTLTISNEVKNLGSRTTHFHLALHTYFDAPEPGGCTIEGLGHTYLDGMRDLAKMEVSEATLRITPPLDRVYPEPKNRMTLKTTTYTLDISQKGFNNAVVWNPGNDHTLKDMKSPWFICLESVAVLPAPSIAPGERWSGEVSYTPSI